MGTFRRNSCSKPCHCGDRAQRGCRCPGCVSAGFTAFERRNATFVVLHLCIPQDGTNAPCMMSRTIGCPLHHISRTKRKNGTHEKSLIDCMCSNSPSQQRYYLDLQGAVYDMWDVDRRDFQGAACLWHRLSSWAKDWRTTRRGDLAMKEKGSTVSEGRSWVREASGSQRASRGRRRVPNCESTHTAGKSG